MRSTPNDVNPASPQRPYQERPQIPLFSLSQSPWARLLARMSLFRLNEVSALSLVDKRKMLATKPPDEHPTYVLRTMWPIAL